ncbi:MAG: hypothetical protein RL220_172 [Bacteroidota bacterium]
MIHRIAILASGAGSNAANIIRHFEHSSSVSIVCVISNRKAAGVLDIARQSGIPGVYVPSADAEGPGTLLRILKEHNVNLVVLAGYLRKVPDDVIGYYKDRILNIHPALLPAHGGPGMFGHHVHESVFRDKDEYSGITVHLVNEHYDEGEILFQAKVRVLGMSASEIEAAVRKLEILHFPAVIEEFTERIPVQVLPNVQGGNLSTDQV